MPVRPSTSQLLVDEHGWQLSPAPDATQIVMLDMAARNYGDATFCQAGGLKILVDGGHRGDDQSDRPAHLSIPDQLTRLCGAGPPFAFDLLVVTHCHADHIGCLPELVRDGIVTARYALVADPKLGFGIDYPDAFPLAPADSVGRVAAALREEPLPASASDGEIAALIDAAATLQQRYDTMLAALAQQGTRVVRFGRDSHAGLERDLAAAGLKILGPSLDQLLICADRIARDRGRDRARATSHPDCDEVALYRALSIPSAVDGISLDDGGASAAVNNQSIVLRVGEGPRAALLTGDMQFAEPGTGGLQPSMTLLRTIVRNAGPYGFVRLAHHGAANGTDAALLDALAPTPCFGISGGGSDPHHPSPSVLALLVARQPALEWARTDRNGAVEITLTDARHDWRLAREPLNASEVNIRPVPKATRRRRKRAAIPQLALSEGVSSRLVGLPRLTFVTNLAALRGRVGATADAVATLITSGGHALIDMRDATLSPRQIAQLAKGSAGLVLLGGHGVVPSLAVDCLPPALRDTLPRRAQDADDYLVWSDDPYGDVDGVGLASLPVSRIPDAGDGALLLAALGERPPRRTKRFGLRNIHRPFADHIFEGLSGSVAMRTSEPAAPADLDHAMLDADQVYLMLHGIRPDLSVFHGERLVSDTGRAFIPAMTAANIPERFGGTVFSGCCYGAASIADLAGDWAEDVSELGIDQSIALSFLHAGARAFVGCTATHYSPSHAPYEAAGGPFHRMFWQHVHAGAPPSLALMRTKVDYALAMPYDESLGERRIEYKTWRQFTCLGLGW